MRRSYLPPKQKKPPYLGGLRVFRLSLRLGPFASQRLVRLLKDEKVDRDDDDDRLRHEVVRLVRHAHPVNVFGQCDAYQSTPVSTIRD